MPKQAALPASAAARALGISLDTLRRWDREGKIRTRRDAANRRVVPVAEIKRLGAAEEPRLSARNRLDAIVDEVVVDGLMAQVEMVVAKGGLVVALITRESAERLGLAPGVGVRAVVKATSVLVER